MDLVNWNGSKKSNLSNGSKVMNVMMRDGQPRPGGKGTIENVI